MNYLDFQYFWQVFLGYSAAGFRLWPRHDLASLGINSRLRLAGATALVICCFWANTLLSFPRRCSAAVGGDTTPSHSPFHTALSQSSQSSDGTASHTTPTAPPPRGSFFFFPCPHPCIHIYLVLWEVRTRPDLMAQFQRVSRTFSVL